MTGLLTPEQQIELTLEELLEPLRRDKATPPALLSWLEENLPRHVEGALQRIGHKDADVHQQRAAMKLKRERKRARRRRELLERFNPPRSERAAFLKHIEYALDRMETAERAVQLSKDAQMARAQRKILRRLLANSRAYSRSGGVPMFSPKELARIIERYEKWEVGWSPLPRSHVQETAVKEGYQLLWSWKNPGEKIVTTKGGNWWHVSRILYDKREGERGANLYRHIVRINKAIMAEIRLR
jgi:hypothetical protein